MGVSGSGKTAVGSRLAAALGVEFAEGDTYHPPANIEKMSSGTPLNDEDRQGWLYAIASRIRRANDVGDGVVVSCSALKRSYRDVLRREAGPVRFVFLRGTRDLIDARLRQRKGHFMPTSLLDSQLATLEEPSADEDVWVTDINETPDEIVASLVARAST
jgi:gluconokinase